MVLNDDKDIQYRLHQKHFPLTGDMDLLSEAVREILNNAVHAAADDHPRLEISTDIMRSDSPFITIQWLKIIIRDYGKGIIPDFLPYVKKPFFTTEKYLGHSGFGLSIAEKILHAHGGFLEISSVKGQFTDVAFFLPVKQQTDCNEK